MPAVSERFKTYRDFASADLEEIYGQRLIEAFKVTANHLESGVWLNETRKGGSLSFRWKSLPWEAQLSPVSGIVTGDFDGDGSVEMILAQNHYSNWLETGPWRGNPGCHLEWDKDQFKVIGHPQSGVFLPNDTKAILTIDVDSDGQEDILVGQNSDRLLLFRNQSSKVKRP